MENKTNKFGCQRLLAVLAIAFACGGMWGCGDDKVSFDWGKYRSDETIAGFIDDSLVIVTDCRRWHKITEGWNGSYSEETSCGHDRMLIYNYRVQEDGPRWTDSLTNTSDGGYWKQLTDSIIWRWNGEKQDNLMLWKIGLPATELKMKKIFENCLGDFEVNRMHQWLDGKFIALGTVSVNGKNIDNALRASDYGNEYCQYAVLDTLTKLITYKRLNEKLEWIKQCDDVRTWGGRVYCLYYDAQSANVYLKIENKVKDSALVENQGWYSGAFFVGDLMLIDGNLCEYKDAWVCYPRQGVLKMGFHADNGIILQF